MSWDFSTHSQSDNVKISSTLSHSQIQSGNLMGYLLNAHMRYVKAQYCISRKLSAIELKYKGKTFNVSWCYTWPRSDLIVAWAKPVILSWHYVSTGLWGQLQVEGGFCQDKDKLLKITCNTHTNVISHCSSFAITPRNIPYPVKALIMNEFSKLN